MIPFVNLHPELAQPMQYGVGDIDRLELCIRFPLDVSELEELLDCKELGRDWVPRIVDSFLNNFLPVKKLVRHQLIVVFLQMREYSCHGVIYGVRCPIADILQISYLNCANDFFEKSLFRSCHLTEQVQFFGGHDLHIGVRVDSCALLNYENTRVSQVNKRSGRDDCILHLGKY